MWFIVICVLTWLFGAALCFLISPLLGIPALLFALLLTEALLAARRAEKSAVGDGKSLGQ
jgi:hypothetical protein